ncbi:hypothetical protein Tco_0787813 [Tanacetum coccineum]
MPQRLTKSSIYSRSLGLSACASLESKNEVCLLCEVSPKANPSLQIHLCFFGEQSQPLKILGKACVFVEAKTSVLVGEGILKQIPAFYFFCASLESISAIEDTWERCGIANMAFIQLGGNSRVGEMILARERSGFAGEKVWDDIQVVTGFLGAGKKAFWGSSSFVPSSYIT